jgi:hypothetical protein
MSWDAVLPIITLVLGYLGSLYTESRRGLSRCTGLVDLGARATGRSEIVHNLDITAKVLTAGREPWADGRRTDLVRITRGFLSGRRIVHTTTNANGQTQAPGR